MNSASAISISGPFWMDCRSVYDESDPDAQLVHYGSGNQWCQAGSIKEVPKGHALTAIGYGSDDYACFIWVKTAPVKSDGTVDFSQIDQNWRGHVACPTNATRSSQGNTVTLNDGWNPNSYPGQGASKNLITTSIVPNKVMTGWTWGADTSGGGPGDIAKSYLNECYYQEYMNLKTQQVYGWGSDYDGSCRERGYQKNDLQLIVKAPAGRVLVAIRLQLDKDANLQSISSTYTTTPPPPDFTLEIAPLYNRVTQGSSTGYSVQVSNCTGGVTQVTLDSIAISNGLKFTFGNSVLTCGDPFADSSHLIIYAQLSPPDPITAPKGLRSFTVTGRSNSVFSQSAVKQVSAQVEVFPQPSLVMFGETINSQGQTTTGTGLTIQAGQLLKLKWLPKETTPGNYCSAFGGWSGDKNSNPGSTWEETINTINPGTFEYKMQCMGDFGTSNTVTVTVTVTSAPSGTIKVNYTLNGVPQSSPFVTATFGLTGPKAVQKTQYSVPKDFTGMPTGSYTFNFDSVLSPSGYEMSQSGFITPNIIQSLSANSSITFTLNFVSSLSLSRVAIEPKNSSIIVGGTQSYKLVAYYSNSSGAEVSNIDVTNFPDTSFISSNTSAVSMGSSGNPKNLALGLASSTLGVSITGRFQYNGITKSDSATLLVYPANLELTCPLSLPLVQKGGTAIFTIQLNKPANITARILNSSGTGPAGGFTAISPANWTTTSLDITTTSASFTAGTSGTSPGSYRFLATSSTGQSCFTDFSIIDEIDFIDITPKDPTILVSPGNPSVTNPAFKVNVHFKSNPSGVLTEVPANQVSWSTTDDSVVENLGSGIYKGLKAGKVTVSAGFNQLAVSTSLTVQDYMPVCKDSVGSVSGCNFTDVNYGSSKNLLASLDRLPSISPYNFGDICFEIYVIDQATGSPVQRNGSACGGGTDASIYFQGVWKKSENFQDVPFTLDLASISAGNYTLAINAYGPGLSRTANYQFSVGGAPSYLVKMEPEVDYIMRPGMQDSYHRVNYKFTVYDCKNLDPNQTFTFQSPDTSYIYRFYSPAYLTPSTVKCNESVTLRLTAGTSAGPIDPYTNNPDQRPVPINITSPNIADKTITPSIFVYGRPSVINFSAKNPRLIAGQSTELVWSSQNVEPGNNCLASGKWSGYQINSDEFYGVSTGALPAGTHTFTLSCRSMATGKFKDVWSSPISVVLNVAESLSPPNPPVLTTSSSDCTSIKINWQAPTSGSSVSSYQVFKNGLVYSPSLPSSARQYIDSSPGAVGSVSYFEVKSTGSTGLISSSSNRLIVGFAGCEANMNGSNKRVSKVGSNINSNAYQNPCDPNSGKLEIRPKTTDKITLLMNLCNTGTAEIDLSGAESNYMIIEDLDMTRLKKPSSGWNVLIQNQSCSKSPSWSVSGYALPACQYEEFGSGVVVRLKNAILPINGNWTLSLDADISVPANEFGSINYFRNKAVITYPRQNLPPGTRVIDTGFVSFSNASEEGVKLQEVAPSNR